jgi:DNA-binding CsgD family transcriptional regulator/tetratricopeptide (TPR) repeat protein
MGVTLVGRGSEQALIDALLHAAVTDHRGGAVAVSAGRGLGRTALLTWAASRAAERGVAVIAPTVHPADAFRPFGVLLGELGPVCQPADPAAPPSPLQLVPDARAATVEQMARRVEARLEDGPLAIVLDDLHLVDDATHVTVGRLLRLARSGPLLLLWSATHEPPSASFTTLAACHQRNDGRQVALAPLGLTAVEALLTERFGAPPGQRLRRAAGAAHGVPGLLVPWLASLGPAAVTTASGRAELVGATVAAARWPDGEPAASPDPRPEPLVGTARAVLTLSPSIAAELAGAALRVTPATDSQRHDRAVLAAEALTWAGEPRQAIDLLDAEGTTTGHQGAAVRARAEFLLGNHMDAAHHALASAPAGAMDPWAGSLAGFYHAVGLSLDDARALATESARATDLRAATLARLVLGWVDNVQGYLDAAVVHFEAALALTRSAAGLPARGLLPELFCGIAQINRGRVADGERLLREGQLLADQEGFAWATPFFHFARAHAHWVRAGLHDALNEIDAGFTFADDHGIWLAALYATGLGAGSHLLQDRLDEASALLDRGDAHLADLGPQLGLEWHVHQRAMWLEAAGRPDEAAAHLRSALGAATGLQARAWSAMLATDFARLAALRGDSAELADAAQLIGPATSSARHDVDLAAERVHGLAQGDAARVEAVRSRHEALGFRLQAAFDEELLVICQLRAGQREAAAAQLHRCLVRCDELDLPGLGQRVRQGAARLGLHSRRRARRRPRVGWEALTPSEREVSELVGLGHGNAEIATALGISRRTVESHLGSVFKKTGITTRAALATEVERRRT